MRERVVICLLAAALFGGCRPGSAPPAREKQGPSRVHFVDRAADAGLSYRWGTGGKHPLNILEIMSAGASFLDFDNDGWLDILLIGNDRCSLFRNEKGIHFRDVTAGSGFEKLRGRWHGASVGDFDNDGRADVFLTGYRRKLLFRNTGEGRFQPLPVPALDITKWGSAGSFLDVDRDGFLDLVAGNYVRFGSGSPEFSVQNGVKITLAPDAYEGEPLQLLINQGGQSFRDASRESGVTRTQGRCLGIAAADFDEDGDDDFYVANDEMPANLFQNDGRGRFRDIGTHSGTAFSGTGRRQGGMGTCWGDYNNDLRLDLFVTTFTQEPKSLYRNDGEGLFSERSFEAGVSQSSQRWVGFGTRFVDVDNDRHLDLPFVSGHVQDLVHQIDPLTDYPQPSKLFRNNGNGTFTDVTDSAGPGFQKQIVGRALAVGDYDNDGRVDLLAADLEGGPLLLHNESPAAGNWLALRLTGTRSNRMAIGARVEITADGVRRISEVRTDGSYLAAHDPRVHFGLGKASGAEKVVIRWPSGARQTLTSLAANQLHEIREAP